MSHRAENGDDGVLASRAADPSTSQADLHQLAADHPELRAAIAENPNAYPQLVDWLRGLNDPDVDAALVRRERAAAEHPSEADQSPPSEGSADHSQHTRALPADAAESARTPPEPTEEFGAVQTPRAAEPEIPAPSSDFDQKVYGTPAGTADSAYTQYPSYEPAPHYGYEHPGYAPAPAVYAEPVDESPPRRRSGGGCTVLIVLALVTLTALAATYFLLFGSPFAEESDPGTANQQQVEENPGEDGQPEAQQPDAEESPAEDSPSPTEDDQEDMARPAPEDALDLAAFSAPSENIHCTLSGDEVACTIDEYFFDAPSGCQETVTVRVGSDGSATTACDQNVSSQGETLDYGEVTGNGDFACEATQQYFECWSQQTGNGFQLAREYYDLYDYSA